MGKVSDGLLGGDAESEEFEGDASFGDQDESGSRKGSRTVDPPGSGDTSATTVLFGPEDTPSVVRFLGPESVGLSGSDSAESGC